MASNQPTGDDQSSHTKCQAAVLVCFDEHYACAAAVMLTSLLENNVSVSFGLYALGDGISPSSKATLASLCARFDRPLRWLKVESHFAEQFRRSGHISRTAYLRIAGPDLIDSERIIYLDVDLIVQTELQPLIEIDFGGKLLLAARDHNPNPGVRSKLGLPWDAAYVNTGVMVLDAETWRSDGITAELTRFYQCNYGDFEWADQDLINAALYPRIGLLERKWNMLYGDVLWGGLEDPDFDPDDFRGIFHFNSDRKPWNSRCDARYAGLYEEYAGRAPVRMPESRPTPARRLGKKLRRRLERRRDRWRRKLTESLRLQRIVGLLHGPPTVRFDLPEAEFSIHTVTCHRDVEMTLWSLKSFSWSSGLSPQVFVHDDGSLTAEDAAKLRRHIHRLTLVGRSVGRGRTGGSLARRASPLSSRAGRA
ncbi:MAG: glycosyltransferase family 8 protein [bacterium]